MEAKFDSELNDDVLAAVSEWTKKGHKAALATVIDTWGSSPRPIGSQLGINDKGELIGSVSGGCIEGAVAKEAFKVMEIGTPKTLEFGVSNEDAWEVGLACGGSVRVFVERID
tara:strand:- start:324 stop:662 length:339 start_codon:yes stop_codon:yes gene_type:complete